MQISDAHCHFFSRRFFTKLAEEKGIQSEADPVEEISRILQWDPPGEPQELAARWLQELDGNDVKRCALMASIPGDEDSVAAVVAQYPTRFVGFFMVDPTREEAVEEIHRAVGEQGLRCICLFPAMHQYRVYEDRALAAFEAIGSYPGTAAFVHCGVLSVGVRRKLGLPSRFAMRFSDPLDLHSVGLAFPKLPIIVPHFGAGLFRETLMLGDLCPNIHVDTSSSNSWIKYSAGLTLQTVFEQALKVFGPERILFGTDSSFFPRGWQRSILDDQVSLLERIGVGGQEVEKILGGNFQTLFPE